MQKLGTEVKKNNRLTDRPRLMVERIIALDLHLANSAHWVLVTVKVIWVDFVLMIGLQNTHYEKVSIYD